MNKFNTRDFLFGVALASSIFIGGCIMGGGSTPDTASAGKVGFKFKAHGLKPLLTENFPKLQALTNGDWILATEGASAKIPADAEVDISRGDADGTVLVTLPGGVFIKINKKVGPFGVIPINATETVQQVVVDKDGMSVQLQGWRHPIYLEAAE